MRILEQTPDRLVIFDPPFYSFGLIFLAIGVFDLLYGHSIYLGTSRKLVIVVTLVLSAASMILGTALFAPRGTTTFSRSDRQITMERSYFGLLCSARQLSLDAIQKAIVETATSNARRIALIPRTGEPILLNSYNSRKGQYDAADAINRFLGVYSSAA